MKDCWVMLESPQCLSPAIRRAQGFPYKGIYGWKKGPAHSRRPFISAKGS